MNILDYRYFEQKDRECIVLLHGIGGNSNIFYKQIGVYRKEYSVLSIHLPGHGDSPDLCDYENSFSFDKVTDDIIHTMNSLKISKAHFVGISLGSIILHNLLQRNPERVQSAVLGGAITSFSRLSLFLIAIGRFIKEVTPFMFVYSLFANIMMPKANHKKTREMFIREAKKMKRDNFIRWFKLVKYAESTYASVQEKSKNIPKLYISGKEDHLFLNPLQQDVEGDKDSTMIIIENCGHVCNIEKHQIFNVESLRFLKENKICYKSIVG